ncbi:MAG TPA: FGGY family carbohydrate kinase [Puia sp.]|uniref:FGGY-family carbohydrate kinase n=1 Tax=Puia sp. TaxID=2045100 RepID=UPI002B5D63B9|nr:FGGY family carbohydrate kinase [Puia sp.]HVU98214.1 FGGY family carbohydrate kinase [Puia sp.]
MIAIFDIGKTNKKLFVFDEQYNIVWERSCTCEQTVDEDGEPCEDLVQLNDFIFDSLAQVPGDLPVRAINFCAYGASFVYIGKDGKPVAPLYNYLKPFPEDLRAKFYAAHGGEVTFSMLTASPVLGSLNSGMQLYRIKEEQPALFEKIRTALHLPQYLSYLLTGIPCSDITSIGCHTNLWNFSQNHYHEWVYREGIIDKLAPILPSTSVLPTPTIPLSGIGLHDSSAAMIPYFESFREPFLLISTGTWCISMNPFNDSPLTVAELQKDSLCYLSYQGKPVKASRLFAGYEHEQRVQELAARFNVKPAAAMTVAFDAITVQQLRGNPHREPESFSQAYHRLMLDIIEKQVASTQLVLRDTDVKRIFVDGGFGKNQVYMHLLAGAFPDIEVFAASIPQASSIGAALAIHEHWNSRSRPGDIIELKYYK